MPDHKILIVDDEVGIRFSIRKFLQSNGYDTEEADSCQTAQEQFRAIRPDLAIIDYKLGDGTGLDLLARLKAVDPGVPMVILTAYGSIDLAVRAIKEGAEQFLTKPIDLPVLLVMIERILENQRTRQKLLAKTSGEARKTIDPFLGNSAAIRRLAEEARRILPASSPILIQGETGTGKSVLARWLHENGSRANEAFVDLNCAGLSREFLETELFGHTKGAFTGAHSHKPGLLEVAHRGTIFLDEIGDVDIQVQPKLLKVLEEKRFRKMGEVTDRTVDIRLIAATHQDLARLVMERTFRDDLYYRIRAIPLTIPPLRERTNDISFIAENLVSRITPELGRGSMEIASDALRALQQYTWPGNIREMRNILERALLLCDGPVLKSENLRFDGLSVLVTSTGTTTTDSNMTLAENERRHIETVLNQEQGQVDVAARRLGISRSALYDRMEKYGLKST